MAWNWFRSDARSRTAGRSDTARRLTRYYLFGSEIAIENGFIALDHAVPRVAEQFIVQFFELLVRQPRSAIGGCVDRLNRLIENTPQRHIPKLARKLVAGFVEKPSSTEKLWLPTVQPTASG